MQTYALFTRFHCDNQVALITGGGSGIGLEITRQLGETQYVVADILTRLCGYLTLPSISEASGEMQTHQHALPCFFSSSASCIGLHGAAVAISGRRQQVLDDAVTALEGEGIIALGLQV